MNLDHLRQLATEATTGKWTVTGNEVWGRNAVIESQRRVCIATDSKRDANAAFIAAANPSVVLALVEVAQAAQEVKDTEDVAEASQRLAELFVVLDALAKLDNLGGTE